MSGARWWNVKLLNISSETEKTEHRRLIALKLKLFGLLNVQPLRVILGQSCFWPISLILLGNDLLSMSLDGTQRHLHPDRASWAQAIQIHWWQHLMPQRLQGGLCRWVSGTQQKAHTPCHPWKPGTSQDWRESEHLLDSKSTHWWRQHPLLQEAQTGWCPQKPIMSADWGRGGHSILILPSGTNRGL